MFSYKVFLQKKCIQISNQQLNAWGLIIPLKCVCTQNKYWQVEIQKYEAFTKDTSGPLISDIWSIEESSESFGFRTILKQILLLSGEQNQ